MGDTIAQLARDLRGFDADAVVAKALKKHITRSAAPVRSKIKKNAVAILPASGGLGNWVAASRITTKVRLAGRTVSLTLRAGRSSANGKQSDVKAIDRGRDRHPSWGRRGKGQWHNQAVPSEWFTGPVRSATEWPAAVDAAVDEALAVIKRG